MISQRVATKLEILLLAIRAKLSADLSWDQSRVDLVLSDEKELDQYPKDESFIQISPYRFNVDQPVLTGGGPTDALVMEGSPGIVVTIWKRVNLDRAGRAPAYLTDQTVGVVQLVRKILKSLTLYDPVDASGNGLLEEPMRPTAMEFRPKRPLDWGKVAIFIEMKYQEDLS